MRFIWQILMAFWLCLTPAIAGDDKVDATETHNNWPYIMTAYLSEPEPNGLVRFDYAALSENAEHLEVLDNYIAYLEAQTPHLMCVDSALGYWANLYNALTVRVVVENYPVESIRKIGGSVFSPGPWKKNIAVVDYEKLSLDDIEHKKMRKVYRNPLIHYMVNCASVGCPNLKAGAWERASLREDAEQAARDFINSPRGVLITEKGLTVSSIYKWYEEDFGGNKAGVLEHLRQYADSDLAEAIDGGAKIIGYDYDWSLNEARKAQIDE